MSGTDPKHEPARIDPTLINPSPIDPTPINPPPINPTDVRYIKLGPGGAWFEHALAANLIELGHAAISLHLARSGDHGAIHAAFVAAGHTQSATNFTREVLDFATLPPTALWITLERGLLWWAFALPEVIDLAGGRDLPAGPHLPSGAAHGVRARRLAGPWRSTDLAGKPLRIETLSGKLARVAGYRRSICQVAAADYVVRRINAAPSPLLQRAGAARAEMLASIGHLLTELDPYDFEVLVDLIFTQGGWRRVNSLGGAQADTDFVAVQPLTGERAFVQIKSQASKQDFEASVQKYRQSAGLSRMFFACHSPNGVWEASSDDVTLWTREALSQRVLEAGLFDWLCDHAP